MNAPIVVGSAVVGFLVGMTGAGGGALMTPMLILLFSVKASTAISSDLVAALVMRPFAAAVHFRRGTVNLRLAAWTTAGSVPAAFFGSYVLHLFGDGARAEAAIEVTVGVVLLVGACAMVVRSVLDRRRTTPNSGPSDLGPRETRMAQGTTRMAQGTKRFTGSEAPLRIRPHVALAIGVLGGTVVGLTSVGAGSLMIVLFMFAFPALGAKEMVGTDLAQAIPLTGAAALGALVFGHVELALTASVIAGSIPAAIAGALVSSRAPDRWVRPVIMLVILAAGMKEVGTSNGFIGVVLLAVIAGGAWWRWSRVSRLPRQDLSPLALETGPAYERARLKE